MNITIRHENIADIEIITQLTQAAFLNAEHSDHTEEFIVNALRQNNQLTLSLVAVENDAIVGHIAISPITISSGAQAWFGLGPISVWPSQQGFGIGSKLITTALSQLQHLNGAGCVVLGNPKYYGRFGFKADARLTLPGVPPEYFQVLSFSNDFPSGDVTFHDAFNATK